MPQTDRLFDRLKRVLRRVFGARGWLRAGKTLLPLRITWRRAAKPERIRMDGFVVCMNREAWSSRIVGLLEQERYEGSERRVIPMIVRRTDRVLEIGSAIGVIAMAIARCRPAAARHYEANPDLLEDARRNFAANGLAPDLRHGAVVADGYTGASVEMQIGQDFFAGSVIGRDVHERSVTVPAVRLSDLLAEFHPTVLVMDVEGLECDLLSSGSLPGVETIAVEMHPQIRDAASCDAMISHLISKGFSIDFSASGGQIAVLRRAPDQAIPEAA